MHLESPVCLHHDPTSWRFSSVPIFSIRRPKISLMKEYNALIFTWWGRKQNILKNMSCKILTSRLSSFLLQTNENKLATIPFEYEQTIQWKKLKFQSAHLFALSCGVNCANFTITSSILLEKANKNTKWTPFVTLLYFFLKHVILLMASVIYIHN